jgi:hypothetical protein
MEIRVIDLVNILYFELCIYICRIKTQIYIKYFGLKINVFIHFPPLPCIVLSPLPLPLAPLPGGFEVPSSLPAA